MSRWAVLSTTENYEYCALKERKKLSSKMRTELFCVLLSSDVVPKRRQKITAIRYVITQ